MHQATLVDSPLCNSTPQLLSKFTVDAHHDLACTLLGSTCTERRTCIRFASAQDLLREQAPMRARARESLPHLGCPPRHKLLKLYQAVAGGVQDLHRFVLLLLRECDALLAAAPNTKKCQALTPQQYKDARYREFLA